MGKDLLQKINLATVILVLWSVGPNGPFSMVKYTDGSATGPSVWSDGPQNKCDPDL